MRAYASFFRLRMQTGLQYRMAGWAGVATQFFWGFLLIMVYEAFYRSAPEVRPMELEQLVTYVWLNQSFLALIMMWIRDTELSQLIVSGNVAYELCRPLNLYAFWYARLVAHRLASATLRFFPILTVAFLLPAPFTMHLPASLGAFAGFIATMAGGLLIVVGLSMLVQVLLFWTLSPAGTSLLFSVLAEFLNGGVIAIPLLPALVQKVFYFLPFAYTADLPFRIYTGHIALSEVPLMLLRQAGWAAALILLGALLMRRALKRVVVHGG